MTTNKRIELARRWLKASREDMHGPSRQWQEEQFDRYHRDLGLIIDFLTDLEDELWPSEEKEMEE